MSGNMHKNNQYRTDKKAIFDTLRRYRFSLFFITLIFVLLAVIYAYFKPNVYKATATIDVGTEESCRGYENKSDFFASDSSDHILFAKEIEIARSRFILDQALQSVDFSHRYYTKSDFKKVELYNDSPFDVNLTKGYNISFEIFPHNDTQYIVKTEGIDRNSSNKWKYNKVQNYGSLVDEKYFTFRLDLKRDKRLINGSYRFMVLDENSASDSARREVAIEELGENTGILSVSVKDNVPLRAQQLANAIADAYIVQSVYKKTREASKTLSFVNAQLKQISDNLKHSAVKLENFKKETNAVNLDSKAKGVMERLSEAEGKLAEIDIEVGLLNTLYSRVKSGKNLETISVSGLSGSGGDQSGGRVLVDLISNLQKSVLKLRVLRADYTDSYPEVIRLKRQISEMKKIIIDTIKNMKRNYSEHKRLLEKSIKEQTELMNKLPEAERVYGGLQRKFVVNEKIYSYLMEKQAATAIEQASAVSKNRVLDQAEYPKCPIEPKRNSILLLSLILGMVVGAVSAFLRDYYDDTIRSKEDIEEATDAPILGVIPHIRKDMNSGRVRAMDAPKSAVAESFRNLRTNLQFMAAGKSTQVISVTSTVGSEGKTMFCANLAGVISLTGKRVIVLGLDMRKPTLHKIFGLDNKQGMSAVLSYWATVSKVIQHTEYKNLDIIPSGLIPPNPSELIQSARMKDLIEMLKSVYDVIILDTPPVGLVTDARPLMNLSDASIYLLRAGQSKKRYLRQIDELFHSDMMHGFSIVLNDIDIKREGYGYGYGYYEDEK